MSAQNQTRELFPTTPRKQPRAKVLPKVEPKPVAAPALPLTPTQLREAARNVKTLQDARAAWKLGDQRDAENPCKHCGAGRTEFLNEITAKGCRVWETRCLTCRPMEAR